MIKIQKKNIEKTIILIDKARMEMMYEGKYSDYYNQFAIDNKEEELLNESDYVLFDLDEYAIKLPNGNCRYWIYEQELQNVKNILIEKKKNIENDINELNINAGVALALMINL